MSQEKVEPEYFTIVWLEKQTTYIVGIVVNSSENIEVRLHTGLDVPTVYSSCGSIALSLSCV